MVELQTKESIAEEILNILRQQVTNGVFTGIRDINIDKLIRHDLSNFDRDLNIAALVYLEEKGYIKLSLDKIPWQLAKITDDGISILKR